MPEVPEDALSYAPDYGLKLISDGIPQDVALFFYDFRLFSLTVLSLGQYSTMVEFPRDGQRYALSLDFNEEQLTGLLAKADPNIASFIRGELAGDPTSPRTIDFDGEIQFGVKARIGKPQLGLSEPFVPLIAVEIW